MLLYILRRIAILIPVYLGLTLSTFTLIRLVPGDAVEIMMGERMVDPELHARALERLGLDKPLIVQYWDYLTEISTGDFGQSFRNRTPVLQDFFAHFVPTLELALCAIVIASVVGVSLGIFAALRRGTWIDYTLMSRGAGWLLYAHLFIGTYPHWYIRPLSRPVARRWCHICRAVFRRQTFIWIMATWLFNIRRTWRILGCGETLYPTVYCLIDYTTRNDCTDDTLGDARGVR